MDIDRDHGLLLKERLSMKGVKGRKLMAFSEHMLNTTLYNRIWPLFFS